MKGLKDLYIYFKPEKSKLTIASNKSKKIKRSLNEIDLQTMVKRNKNWLSKDQNRKQERNMKEGM